MRKNYFKKLLLAMGAVCVSLSANAIDAPKIGSTLTDGGTYVLMTDIQPNGYWTRTSWDGALCFQGFNMAEQEKASFTAQDNGDGTWTFIVNADEAKPYLAMPNGSPNLNTVEEPAKWVVETSDREGYYKLKADEGNNFPTIGRYLHLNAGGDYAVISYLNGPWYPDFWGGVETDTDGEETWNKEDENGWVIPVTHESEYWQFATLDNLGNYGRKMQLYTAILDIEENKLEDADFKAGYQGAIDALTAIYNQEELTDEDVSEAMALITAKNKLYDEILTATEESAGSSDEAIKAAIETAKTEFNTKNTVDELAAALQALIAAESAFGEGTGDLTRRGMNMDFDDLSNQGGTPTTGVGGAPAGWNLYVNGTLVNTPAEQNAAGLNGWAGINADGTGAKNGEYIYGIWNTTIPEIELSQTITDLANGTYTIRAAVMVGANGAGSRRTTQRIFGNLNSKYFGSAIDYDDNLLDKSEVYDFENLTEPVTDTELQEMSVRAFVYDGTLTFGFRTNGDIKAALRDATNSAGGDGWFKIDNFRIQKEGYSAEDAIDVYNHFFDALDELNDGRPIQKDLLDELDELSGNKLTERDSQEDIIAGIVLLKERYPVIKASADAYTKLGEAIDKAYEDLQKYSMYAGADDYSEIIYEAVEMQDECEAGVEEIDEMIKRLEDGLTDLKMSGAALGDITDLIVNPSFEDLTRTSGAPYGWTLVINGEENANPALGWCGINSGDNIDVVLEDGTVIDHQYTDGTHLWGIWDNDIPEVELSQTLTGMPEGTYTLTADVMVQYQWAGNNITTQRIFGNDYVQMWGIPEDYDETNMPEDALNAAELTYAGYRCENAGVAEHQQPSSLLQPMKVTFGVSNDGILKFGFRTNGKVSATTDDGDQRSAGWFKLDNFRLSWDSEEVPTDIKGVSDTTPATGKVEFYGLDGRRLNAPQHGINIMKGANGKTTKVIVK